MFTSRQSASDVVLFVERSGELLVSGKVKHKKCGAEGKPSLKRANESDAVDPKPGDLSMSRLKFP